MDINERIKYLAGRRGWTEYRLVKESHLPASTIANIYHRSTVPSISTLEAICDALGLLSASFSVTTRWWPSPLTRRSFWINGAGFPKSRGRCFKVCLRL